LYQIYGQVLPLPYWERWRGPRGITIELSWITVDTLHMVSEIPVAWETISSDASLAVFIGTKEGFVAASMHSVGLTFMAK
jgi:hypothetical protein